MKSKQARKGAGRSSAKPDRTQAAQIVKEIETAIDEGRYTVTYPRKGRPSLTGAATPSPSVGFRLTPELRRRAEKVAHKEGVSVSALARKALTQYLQQS